MVDSIATQEPSKLQTMRYLADQCVGRRLIHDLVAKDVARWDSLDEMEREIAFDRAVRRVAAVCPWTNADLQPRLALHTED